MNNSQERIAKELLLTRSEFPVVELGIANEIRTLIESELELVVPDELVVTKSRLTAVHQCEGLYTAPKSEFTWTFELVAGVLTHLAIQHQHQDCHSMQPAYYVETALEVSRAEGPIQDWLISASHSSLLEVLHRATTHVEAWTDCWPPLRREWRVRGEMSLRANLLDGRLALVARPDLVIGPVPSQTSARQAIVDLKTSDRLYSESREEAWFYALVYLLRVNTPPHSSIVYSIPSGEWHSDYQITRDRLVASARRTIAGVKKMMQLHDGRAPSLTPSPKTYCGWCTLRESCDAYQTAVQAPGFTELS